MLSTNHYLLRHSLLFITLFLAISLLGQTNFERAVQLINKGDIFDENKQFSKGLTSYRTALDLLLISGDSLKYIGLAYSNIGYNNFSTRDYNKAVFNLRQGLRYYQKAGHTKNISYVNGLRDLAIMNERIQQIDSANYYYQAALEDAKALLGSNDISTVKFYNSAGYSQNRYGDIRKAIPLFKKAREILIQNNSIHYNWSRTTATNLGDSYNRLINENLSDINVYGDSAVHFYQEALEYSKKSLPSKSIKLAQAYYNVAGMLNNIPGETDESIMYLDSATNINTGVLRDIEEKASFYYRGAQLEYDIKDYSASKRHFLLAVEYLIQDKNQLRGGAWLRIAGILLTQGHFAEAKDYLIKACEAYRKELGDNHDTTKIVCQQVENAITWNINYIRNVFSGMTDEEILIKLKSILLSDEEVSPELELIARQLREAGTVETMAFKTFEASLEFKKGNSQQALKIIQNALGLYFPGFNGVTNFSENPVLGAVYPEPGNLYSFFALKALIFHDIGVKNKDEKALLDAFHAYEKADTLLNEIRLNSIDEGRINISEVVDGLYKGMSIVALELHNLTRNKKFFEKFFYASEKARVFTLLSEAVAPQKIAALAPENLVLREKKLKINILRLRKDGMKGQEVAEELFTTKTQLSLLQEQLKKSFPQYWETKYSQPVVELEKFLETIDDRTLNISYNVSKNNSVTITYIGKDFVQTSITKTEGLKDSISLLNRLILSKNVTTADYLSVLNFLSAELIPTSFPERIQHITFIPDGELHVIPFELLFTNKVNNKETAFSELPFLIKKYEISYGISASHTYKQLIEKAETDYPTFLFAYNVIQLKEMAAVEQLGSDFNKKIQVFRSKKASRSDLLSRDFSQYQVLQITAHGNRWNDISLAGIIFYNLEKVYYHDIYGLNLSTDLVFLMGCGTAQGDFLLGEGNLGLNRALIAAGASNILLCKYQPDSKTANAFTKEFYKQIIVNDLTYSAAVRKAQLKILASREYMAPWHWSGYQLIGD